MKKIIWVIGNQKQDMVSAQQSINKNGGMRATCILTREALDKNINKLTMTETENLPSLIILDYEMYEADDSLISMLHTPALLGVPLFFMMGNRSRELDEVCYQLGATVVLKKPFSDTSVMRIERAALQYDMTRAYETTVQKQVSQIHMAKEIAVLNEQLKQRNELLYRAFGKYFSDEVVKVILERPEGADLGGQRNMVTVMMADLRGFTSLSEHLTAEAVVDILNHFFGEMTEIIKKRRGTIIEFIGDEILAVFGKELFCDNPEVSAVTAAIEMQNRMHEVNRFCLEKGYPEIEMGIGLHRGEVFVGNIGSEQFMRYNVIGQAVNMCSRIESYCVGGQILISHDTLRGIDRPIKCNQEVEISVKGIGKPIKVYEVFGIETEEVLELQAVAENDVNALEEPISVWLRALQEKRVLDQVIEGRVKAYGDHFVLFERNYSKDEMKKYENIEMALEKGTEKFAYAKVIELTQDGILARITYMPKDFWNKG